MSMGRLYGFLFFLSILAPRAAWGQQTDCEETITHATDEFNAGHFYNIPAILNNCLKSFTREQKQRAYLLLTQTYLLLDDPIGAEKSYLEILRANPEFVAKEDLHAIDVVYLSKRYTATPKFSLFVRGGSNITPVRVIMDLSNDPHQGNSEKKYTFRPGYQIGGGAEYTFDDRIRFRTEVNYLHTAYSAQAFKNFGEDREAIIDRQTWINVPLYVCYTDNSGLYRPYGYAGYSVSRFLAGSASISLDNVTSTRVQGENQNESFQVESPDFDFKKRRNAFDQSLIFGGGIKYKIGLDFLFVEARYSAGMKNVVRPEDSFADYSYDQTSDKFVASMSAATEYRHRDPYLRLDNVSISVGYIRPLYKPRELKRARTRSVLRKIKRSK